MSTTDHQEKVVARQFPPREGGLRCSSASRHSPPPWRSRSSTHGAAGPANAATPTFELCNYGSDYRVSAGFTGTPLTTSVIPPGACTRATVKAGTYFHLPDLAPEQRGGVRHHPGLDLHLRPDGRADLGSFNTFGHGKLPC
ncbi:hypothetical protein GCM10018963_64670 [Saccharothrix longispora]